MRTGGGDGRGGALVARVHRGGRAQDRLDEVQLAVRDEEIVRVLAEEAPRDGQRQPRRLGERGCTEAGAGPVCWGWR